MDVYKEVVIYACAAAKQTRFQSVWLPHMRNISDIPVEYRLNFSVFERSFDVLSGIWCESVTCFLLQGRARLLGHTLV